ncbi:MAG: hypothetical protein M0Z50_03360 [Planctomycetia bacterium]|nr:hypothetical protein [Planctomycetia bacterium]
MREFDPNQPYTQQELNDEAAIEKKTVLIMIFILNGLLLTLAIWMAHEAKNTAVTVMIFILVTLFLFAEIKRIRESPRDKSPEKHCVTVKSLMQNSGQLHSLKRVMSYSDLANYVHLVQAQSRDLTREELTALDRLAFGRDSEATRCREDQDKRALVLRLLNQNSIPADNRDERYLGSVITVATDTAITKET